MIQTMPIQGIDLKEGVYKTDADLMTVIRSNYQLVGDLAASEENAQASRHFSAEQNSLVQDWNAFGAGGWLWLNPPYDNIDRWARKCVIEMQAGANILFLVPASVGSNWFRKYVEGIAKPIFLNGRLVFDFTYPEDYMDKKTIKINESRALLGQEPIVCARAGKKNTDPYPKDMMLAIFSKDIFLDGDIDYETWDWKQELF